MLLFRKKMYTTFAKHQKICPWAFMWEGLMVA